MVRTRKWLVTEEPEIIRVDKAEVKIESVTPAYSEEEAIQQEGKTTKPSSES